MANEQPIQTGIKTERSFMKDLPKYFVHGLLYSALSAVGSIILAVISVAIVGAVSAVSLITGELIGWVVAAFLMIVLFIVALLILGIVNTLLSRVFWKAFAPMNWRSLVGHGGLMLVLLFIFGIPALLLDFVLPPLDIVLTTAILIPRVLIYAVIYGYTGKFVALGFTTIPSAVSVTPAPAGIIAACPECAIETLCVIKEQSNSKVINCTGCGKPFEVFRPE
jgi:hypothetical protein